jgi:hypothetical protein
MPDQQPTPAVPTVVRANATEPAAMPSPPAPPASSVVGSPVLQRSRSARLLNVALAGALVLAVAGVAFAVGRFTAPSTVSAGNLTNGGGFFRNGQDGQGGQNGQGGGRGAFLAGGGLTIEGTVESIDATTLTLKTASGQTIQIALDGSTTYHAQSDASASDVTAGGKVLVRLDARGGFGGGPQSTGGSGGGTATSPAASDVTVVP